MVLGVDLGNRPARRLGDDYVLVGGEPVENWQEFCGTAISHRDDGISAQSAPFCPPDGRSPE